MKNLGLMIVALCFLSVSTQAQKKQAKTATLVVPEVVDASFATHYADVTEKNWTKNFRGNYVAHFSDTVNKATLISEFNKEGIMINRTTNYDVADRVVPENIQLALQAEPDYADLQVESVTKIEIEGVAPYFTVKGVNAQNKKKTLYISEEGMITE